MEKITLQTNYILSTKKLIYLVFFLFSTLVYSQVRVPFAPRTASATPGTTIYHVKGDFTLIGNTNLTLSIYGDNTNNSNNVMKYVDSDSDSDTFNSSSADLTFSTENGAVPACSNVVFAGLYWTGRASDGSSSPDIFNVTKGNVTKTFNKRKVKLKGPSSSSYTEITANTNDIYYPNSSDGLMYSAFAEITDYVKNNGLGSYTLADIALVEGNGGSTGYYGGWSIIVVYENSKMKWRDITVFDGHAYVQGSTTVSHQIPISGFNAVQTGPVNVKLGLMAGEGDVGISGDYFNILRSSDNNWQSLSHTGNSTNNFFNGSIQTGGNLRTPNLQNNTGLDISMFDIPNTGNSVIANSQTSTTLRYGSTQDTYIIFMAAFAIDAYIPDAEGVMSLITINGLPPTPSLTVQPGEEIEYSIKILNEGTEPVNNTVIKIQMPYTVDFIPGSEQGIINFTPLPTPNNLSFNPTLGGNGTLFWDIGTLPVPAAPTDILGELKFKVKVTEDCFLLKNLNCTPSVPLYGYISGVGGITGIVFNDKPFIQGYETSGTCIGDPITDPIVVNIDSADYIDQNCQDTETHLTFSYCGSSTVIPFNDIASNFPAGTQFYNSYPVTGSSIEYTSSNTFPTILGSTQYYGVPPVPNGCFFIFTISVVDSPTVTAPSTGNFDGCDTSVIAPLAYSESSVSISLQDYIDAGGSVSNNTLIYDISYIDVSSGGCPLVVTRTFTIVTTCSNHTVNQIIDIDDTTAPVIDPLPAVSTINCPDTPVFAQATASDNCGSDFELTFEDVTTYGDCAGSYSVTRTWTATDACGNASTASQTINVQDIAAPVIDPLPAVSTINCPDTPVFAQATASDNCGSDFTLTFEDVTTNGDCAGAYSVTRTWTATDACGNASTASQTINVQDIAAPVIDPLPATSTINCPDTPVFAQATASDNCGSNFTLTFEDVTTNGQCAGSYSVTRTWTATDACGNASTASQTINVQDIAAPVIDPLPAVSTINCPDTPVFAQATASDNCGSDFTLTFEDVTTSGDCAGAYSVTRTWTATDACGNASTASQTINVQDIAAPVIDPLPAVSTINCPDTPVFAQATASDNCGSDFTLTFEDVTTNGQCAGSYSVTRTWTATDACGNASTASQTINVQDIAAPVIDPLPAVSTINCPDTPVFAQATASDNCGSDFTLTFEDVTTNGQCAGSYSVTRTWTATDACGNASTASQTINVQDIAAPVIDPLPAVSTINCPDTPVFAQATASDNCGSDFTLTFEDVTTNGDCAGAYSVTRTWTATDACGNASTASQTINVQDIAAPVIDPLPATSTINCPDTPVFAQATASDNCGSDFTLTFEDVTTNGQCAGSYSVTRTWTATDYCGNASTASQTINVQDISAPVIDPLPAVSTINCPDTPVFAQATASDNCGSDFELTFEDVTTYGDCAGSYSVTRTWTATDACGNASTASQTINVQDIAAPVIDPLPAVSTINCPDTPVFAQATASDNCGSDFTLTFEDVTTNGDCAGAYSVTRTWTATDACGNASTASQTINVQDIAAPVIDPLPATSTINCPDTPVFAQATASDNCGSNFTLTFEDVTTNGDCAGSYSVTRTWTATDACGNASTASQTINVQDISAPVIDPLPAVSTINCPDTPVFAQATASDNCGSDFELTFEDVTTNGDCAGSYSVTRTWTATDACGNASTASQTINVQDITIPYFTSELPENISVSCDDVPAPAELTAADSCSTEVNVSVTDEMSHNEEDCAGNYSITRTWTITDECGNFDSYSQIITVYDTTPPTLVTPLDEVVNVMCSEVPEVPTLEFEDNCSGIFDVVYEENTTIISIYDYIIVRDWTVSDNCGNISNFSQTINVSVAEPFDAIPYSICIEEVALDLFSILDDSIPTNGEWIDVSSTGGLNGSIFDPVNVPVGYYTFQYVLTLEDNDCPMIFEIYLNVNDDCVVLPACSVEVYNAVSPNNDGLNDIFLIDGLECYPNNTVEIYNRWGILVYDATGYDNGVISFKGYSEGRSTFNKNEQLPDGTYFYTLKYTDEENKMHDISGYLYLDR